MKVSQDKNFSIADERKYVPVRRTFVILSIN